jgi:transposase-like protein
VTYSPDLAVRICALVADGMSIRRVCRMEDMPNVNTIYEWIRDKPEFAQMLSQAREDQADSLADDIRDAADTLESMANDRENPPNSAAVQAHKVRLDALIWTASKLKPRKYSEKQQIDVTQSSYKDVLQEIADRESKVTKRAPKASNTRAKRMDVPESTAEVGSQPNTTH